MDFIVNMDASKDGITLFRNFVALHKPQLETSGVPRHFWESLCKKLSEDTFDAGLTFQIQQRERAESEESDQDIQVVVIRDEGISANDPNHIYLIDHAWTYRVHDARRHLREINGLLERMMALMDVAPSGSNEEDIEKVFNKMWKYNQTYSIGAVSSPEDATPIWYIMDEFGSAIQHSNNPNFRAVPFLYKPQHIPYSLLFPIKDVSKDEEVTRDYVEGPYNSNSERDVLLLPWYPKSFLHVDFHQEEPHTKYFLDGHIPESVPEENACQRTSRDPNRKLKVYSQYRFVNEYLKHTAFEITNNEEEADILWYTEHFRNFKELSENSPSKYINQFPYEYVLTVKDLLAIICRRVTDGRAAYNPESLETYPLWLPTTFNLKSEVTQFVSYYQHREEKGLDNHWICKPWNLARGMDTHITRNIDYLLRLPFTGPKIAQKYLEDPVLFNRPEIGMVKFDIRYVLLLKSVKPLEAFAYRNFFLRFANKCFELKDFDDYEKHFTVMNYDETASLCRMLCHEFIPEFSAQYPVHSWDSVEDKIFKMLHEMLEVAISKTSPKGICPSPQSRALYAVDIMLAWQDHVDGNRVMQPKLLEVNWCPDCQRACEYYPSFYDDVFGLLFLNEKNENIFKML